MTRKERTVSGEKLSDAEVGSLRGYVAGACQLMADGDASDLLERLLARLDALEKLREACVSLHANYDCGGDGWWKVVDEIFAHLPDTATGGERMSDVFTCTPENPWSPEKRRRARHTNVREVGGQTNGWPGGDIVTYECKNCGHRWREELPQ
jgi:hypothetical protein